MEGGRERREGGWDGGRNCERDKGRLIGRMRRKRIMGQNGRTDGRTDRDREADRGEAAVDRYRRRDFAASGERARLAPRLAVANGPSLCTVNMG